LFLGRWLFSLSVIVAIVTEGLVVSIPDVLGEEPLMASSTPATFIVSSLSFTSTLDVEEALLAEGITALGTESINAFVAIRNRAFDIGNMVDDKLGILPINL
jgi:hypothetical protein